MVSFFVNNGTHQYTPKLKLLDGRSVRSTTSVVRASHARDADVWRNSCGRYGGPPCRIDRRCPSLLHEALCAGPGASEPDAARFVAGYESVLGRKAAVLAGPRT